jgi:hypothetical protein
MAGDTSLSENYAFAGMYHVFDQHVDEAGESVGDRSHHQTLVQTTTHKAFGKLKSPLQSLSTL